MPKNKFDVILNKLKQKETLKETLDAGNVTEGFDVVITHGDSIIGEISGNSGNGGDLVLAGGVGVSGGDVFIDGGSALVSSELDGDVFIQNLKFMRADSSAGDVVATDGNGSLIFQNPNAEVRATKEILVADSPYIVTSGDFTVRCNTISGAIIINIPPANDVIGRILNFKTVNNTNAATLSGDGSELIDAGNIFMLTSLFESVTIQSNGTNWDII